MQLTINDIGYILRNLLTSKKIPQNRQNIRFNDFNVS